jgi:hypothetical protein
MHMLKWKYNIKTGLTDLWEKEAGTLFVDQDKDH